LSGEYGVSKQSRLWNVSRSIGIFVVALFAAWALGREAGGQAVAVRHPNLLLTQAEIEQIKVKVRENEWAARLLDRVKAKAQKDGAMLESALSYVLTGEVRYGASARKRLLEEARSEMAKYEKLDIKAEPEWGRWSWWGATAWAYDLVFDACSAEERAQIEKWLRTAARTIIAQEKVLTTTPNLVFCEHWRVGMIGYCLGDLELIEWALRDPGVHGPSRGGFYPVMDTMIRDERFWAEAPIYALHYDVHGMFALAEAALRFDGTDLYKYESPKSSASLKKLVDGYLRMAFPLERTGPKAGSIRLATFGDGSTGCQVNGRLDDTFLDENFMAVLELAYARFEDEGYAWMLSLDPEREAQIRRGRPAFSHVALTHGKRLPAKPEPPPAPCGLYPTMGFAMLRSDESPRYWTSGGLTAVVRLGTSVGHGHDDYFSLILHGKGHLLYPDLNVIQYEPRWLNWTMEGIGHSTLLIDHESPKPGKQATRHEFAPEVKFFAVEGSAFERSVQERALVLTNDYLADVFHAADTGGRERTFDWVLHGFGRLYPGNPAAYRASTDLVPHYGWIDHERSRAFDETWQADWVQGRTGIREREGKEPESEAGVRVTLLGAPGTRIYAGEGPLVDAPPHHRLDGHPEPSCPVLVVRRKGSATTYAAVHEPYTDGSIVQSASLIEESADGIGMKVVSGKFSDRLLLAYGHASERAIVIRSPDGEAFRFAGYGYVRTAGDNVIARGKLTGFRVRTNGGPLSLMVNGKKEEIVVRNGFLVYGDVPEVAASQAAAAATEDDEARAWVHSYFLPEEVRLKAGAEREAVVTLRAVGRGEASGAIEFVASEGISVEPQRIELSPPLAPGAERAVSLRIKTDANVPSGLFEVIAKPAGDTRATENVLPVSVGVVLKKDRRIPRLAQWVARAPGYTMKVDEFSGVGTCLLDSEGHRRFGRFATGNFIYGFGAVQRGREWIFRGQQACQQVWNSPNSLTFLSDGRLNYEFRDDQIVIKYLNPPRADEEQTVWLGNFDMLEAPIHNGTQRVPHEPVVAEWLYFPHPIYREGVLLRFSKKTAVTLHLSTPTVAQSAVHFPMRSGEEVSLGFVTREELPK
jgi:Alginate lyase/Heparinase II/III-like protein